ncbi:MAG: hypothetical protein RQ824_02525 [bacterium]|nr:hypothetical protein [bacterium]
MKKNSSSILLFALLLMPALSIAQDRPQVDIRDLMTQREFSLTGLNKLSENEIEALNLWLITLMKDDSKQSGRKTSLRLKQGKEKEKKGLIQKLFGGATYKTYEIQEVTSNYSFIINDNRFDSTSICPGYKAGDLVIFTEGSAKGFCDTAEFSRPDGSARCEALCK